MCHGCYGKKTKEDNAAEAGAEVEIREKEEEQHRPMSKDLTFPFSALLPEGGAAAKPEPELEQRQAMASGAGLFRFRSAPSNLFGEACGELFPSRSDGSEAFGSSSVGPAQEASGEGVPGLVRHGSSPAGLFSHLGTEKGFNTGKLKSQLSFSSRQGSSNFMSQITEVGNESFGERTSSEGSDNNRCYAPGYAAASWEDSMFLSESFPGAKRSRDDRSEIQITEMGNHGPSLTRHLSLPKTMSEPRYIQFQDGVPWKLRAKRGCATHPRSIAERVRRTKISERIKKLQDLVPNMDKQTSTADMLELAAEYIKQLQREAKTLSDNRANCTCLARPSDGRG